MSAEITYRAWVVEAKWTDGSDIYLATNGHCDDRDFFMWTQHPEHALRFSDWDSANGVRRTMQSTAPGLSAMGTQQRIAEHEYFGDGGAMHSSRHIRRTGRTQ